MKDEMFLTGVHKWYVCLVDVLGHLWVMILLCFSALPFALFFLICFVAATVFAQRRHTVGGACVRHNTRGGFARDLRGDSKTHRCSGGLGMEGLPSISFLPSVGDGVCRHERRHSVE